MKIIDKNGLKISSTLYQFVNEEAIPGTKVNSDDFWSKFSKIVHQLAPINKSLVEKREIILSNKTVKESPGFFSKIFGGSNEADTFIVRVSLHGEKGQHTLITIENESYARVQTSPTEELIRGLYANVR